MPLPDPPAGIHSPMDYAPHARARLDPNAWAYFEAAAGDGLTRRANRAGWDAIALWPRVLRTLPGLDCSVELLGRRWPSPLLVAPMALQRLAHADGEFGMALAAAAQATGLVLSSQTSTSLVSVADAVRGDAGRGPLWFQLYLQPDRDATLEIIRRAESAGYEALVLTVDASVRAAHGDLRLPPGVAAVHGSVSAGAGLPALLERAVAWDDVAWLLRETRLPVLLKGVLHPDDARQARLLGVRGLVVSNHGGRHLDGAVATAVALPRIADAVGGTMTLVVDGGIERGGDVLKARALGADAVLVGRPVLYGLAAAGAVGAAHVLRLLRDQLSIAMAQCGVARLQDADRGLVNPEIPSPR